MTYYKEINATDEQLREWGITYDDAYFMSFGDYPKHKWGNTCKPPVYDNHDNEHSEEAYREFQQANYDEYFDWAQTYRHALYG